MNTESVVAFLGNAPLLQRLPSSLQRIAEVVVLKHYDRGDYVVRQDQDLDGVYFILDGEAHVLESAEEENCSEFLLKRFDFFGPGICGNVHPADVVAVSKLTCLLLLCDHCTLLETKSACDSDEQLETCSLVERILYLDQLDLNIFQAITLPNAPTYGKVFGGQLVGQVNGVDFAGHFPIIAVEPTFLLLPPSSMNTESVVEFLGNVPLLQRLLSSTLKRIAEVVVLKHYGRGDYVVREDQDLDGVYFILEGEAQVLESAEEENCSEFLLKRFDYFGRGISGDVHPADVVAVSELTCLLLSCDHCALLESKSIWDSDEQFETCSLVERILHLDHLDLNIFQAITLPNAPSFGKVFGGQFVGQALAAASKTVDFLKTVHNLHSCFLRVGDIDIPIIYEVHRISDGNKFATRRVDARQKGKIIYILFASFQREEEGYIHQDSTMPIVPAPESLLSREELHDRCLTDPRLPRDYRNKVAAEEHPPSPIDIRLCEPNDITELTKSPPRLRYWFRVKGEFSDDQALHRCAVAFVSDLMFACVTMNPHRRNDLTISALSLDHSMWFHRPLRADDWLLFVMVSPIASGCRGFTSGEMFNRKGELVVSLTQEALLKEAATVKPTFGSKL